MTETSERIRDAALEADASGIVVLPASPDGSKTPGVVRGKWRQYQQRRPTDDEMRAWFVDHDQDGMGFICGAVSGGLEMLEFEDEATHAAFIAMAHESGLGEIIQRIVDGYSEQTPGGGTHWFYRLPGTVSGNTKLASKPCPGEPTCGKHIAGKPHVLIETRGEGGWVVTAPSGGRTHESGLPYVLVSGGPFTIAELADDEHSELWALARTFDRMPQREVESTVRGSRTVETLSGERPGDVYNARADWREVLEPHGWTFLFHHGELSYWRRPGKQRGVSATTGRRNPADPTSDLLWVFSTSTEFEAEAGYSKWRAYAVLNHGGDFAGAAQALRGLGYYTPHQAAQDAHHAALPPVGVDVSTGEVQDGEEPPARSSWAPHDLERYMDPDAPGDPPPSVGFRDDGQALFYPARTNSLFGESGSMKSFIAGYAVVQTIMVGEAAVVVDFESTGGVWIARLRAMGATDEALRAHFAYIRPSDPLGPLERTDLDLTLAAYQPSLVVLDGMTDAVGLHGLEVNSNKDIATFDRLVLKHIADQGPALVTIDHVGRNPENRNGHAIGAQHKRAAVTGVSYEVRAIAKFGRGRTGHAVIRATKDRPGYIDALGPGEVASFHFTANEDGTQIDVRVEAPEGTSAPDGGWLPTVLMGRVSEYVEQNPGASLRGIVEAIRGKRIGVIEAIKKLVTYGFIRTEDGARNSTLHFSVRPYRDGDPLHNTSTDDRFPPFPDRFRETVSDRFPPPFPPRRGERGTVAGPEEHSEASVSRETVSGATKPKTCTDCGTVIAGGRARCEDCTRSRAQSFDDELQGRAD